MDQKKFKLKMCFRDIATFFFFKLTIRGFFFFFNKFQVASSVMIKKNWQAIWENLSLVLIIERKKVNKLPVYR